MISPGQSKLYYISTHGSYLFKNLAIIVAASSREMNSVGRRLLPLPIMRQGDGVRVSLCNVIFEPK